MTNSLVTSLKKTPWFRVPFTTELLFLTLLITPFVSIVDVAWMLTTISPEDWGALNTPIALKIAKDVILILLVMGLAYSRKLTKQDKIVSTIFLFIIALFVILQYLHNIPWIVTISGVRWFLPLFLIPLFNNQYFSLDIIKKIYLRYKYVMYACLFLQICQLIFSTRWGACFQPQGCRTNGFFSMPQPMAIFAFLFVLFSLKLYRKPVNKIDLGVGILSIISTKSAAGFMGLAILAFIETPKRFKPIIAIATATLAALFPIITGRTSFWLSPLVRFKILRDIDYRHTIFGSYSNTCNSTHFLNIPNSSMCSVPDSLLSGLFGNLGIILAPLTLLLILSYMLPKNKRIYIAALIIFLAGGSYTEYFPTNIFFPFLLGYKIYEADLNKTSDEVL